MEKTSILIIEDNTDVRESTAEILSLAGYQIFQAAMGKHGVELAIRFKPDLILCDIVMPDLDGYGVLHILNSRDETSVIPFVFLTAKTEKAEVRKAMEMGADDYLTKPFDDRELMQAIEARLVKSARQKRIFSNSLDQLDHLFSQNNGLDALKHSFNKRKVRQLNKKQIIYYEGDSANSIYLVLSGSVKIMKTTEDGRKLLMAVHGPDEYFGITAILADEEYKETAEVIEDCTLCALPKEILDQLIYRYPDVAERFIKILAGNLLQHQEQLLQLAFHSVRKRMAELLVKLHPRSDNNCLELSRDNLAAMAGIATETVSRVLTDFKDAGLISRNNRKITIVDIEALKFIKY